MHGRVWVWIAGLLGLSLFLAGCAAPAGAPGRRFEFPRDTLSITNETRWTYGRDPATGRQVHVVRDPPPTYSLRCFVMARAVKLFHIHAEFDPAMPPLDEAGYRRRIRDVIGRSPSRPSEPGARVRFPGYPGLHAFSAAWPKLFQEECGAGWESYFQKGHWRMVLPFSRRGQAREAERIAARLAEGHAVAVHVVDFPGLKVNHGLVFYEAGGPSGGWTFRAYDPNTPGESVEIRFDAARRQFVMQPVPYFIGGDIDLYEVYRRWDR